MPRYTTHGVLLYSCGSSGRMLLQNELQSHLPFDLSIRKACPVLSQVCLNRGKARDWSRDGWPECVPDWSGGKQAFFLAEVRTKEGRSAERSQGFLERWGRDHRTRVRGRNWQTAPTIRPFFFFFMYLCFYSSFSQVQRLIIGQKEQSRKTTWKSNSRKEME